MSSVVISGNTSGTVTLAAPDVAGSTTITLPSTSGTMLTTTSGQWITTGSDIYYNTGNVGIGTSSPNSNSGFTVLTLNNASNGGMLDFNAAGTRVASMYCTSAGAYAGTVTATPMQFITNATERMRIDSSGNVSVNGASTAGQLTSSANAVSQNPLALIDTGTTYNTGIYFIRFVNSAGNTSGAVQHTAVATVAYATTSDIRLKENIEDAPEALDKVMNVKVRSYDWKDDVTHVDYGFIAQELYEVIPEVVGKGSDTETIDDDKGTWQVEYGRLTPILIKAIQELSAKVTELEAKLQGVK